MRAFVAIALPPELIEAIRAAVERLRSRELRGVSWTRPETIHLTLKFLGEVDEARIDEIGKALQEAAKGIKPFDITASGIGAFPNVKNPRVLWVGVKAEEALFILQSRVEDALSKIGLARDERQFKPHLTFCRIKSMSDGRALSSSINTAGDIDVLFSAASFSLYRSVLERGGARHTVLQTINLTEV